MKHRRVIVAGVVALFAAWMLYWADSGYPNGFFWQLVVEDTASIESTLNMNSNLINNVTDPSAAQDAATKNYHDSNPTQAAGSSGDVQYNDGSSGFTAEANFNYDGADLKIEDDFTLGDNTNKELVVLFDQATTDIQLYQKSGDNRLTVDKIFSVENSTPQFVFQDTDSNEASPEFTFAPLQIDTTDGDEYFGALFSGIIAGSPSDLLEVSMTDQGGGDGQDDIFMKLCGDQTCSNFIEAGYAGNSGTTYPSGSWFIDGNGINRVYFSVYAYFDTTTKNIYTSPDGTCSECGPDNSDTWGCSSISCP